MSLDIHSAIVEGLNKFVEMIVAPINERIAVLEERPHSPVRSLTDEEQRAYINQHIDEVLESRLLDSLRDEMREYVNDKLNDDLSSAIVNELQDMSIDATLNVRRR